MDNMNNIVIATFLNSRSATTVALTRIDYGQILKVSGIDLPPTFEVDFCNQGDPSTKTQIGMNDEVVIPNEYLTTGKDILAFIFLHSGENDGETVYRIRIPVKTRPLRSNDEPTPVQQDAITQAIAALNAAVEQTGDDVVNANAAKEAAQAAQEAAEEAAASIDEGMIADAVADYLDEHPVTVDETDPTVPEWAKQPTKPSYTASEVGAVPSESGKGLSTNDYTTAEKEKLAGIEAGADKTPDLSGYATKTELNGKVDKVSGKGLSTNDYTTAEKDKLSGIEAGAQKNPDLSHYVTDSDYNPNSKTSDQTQAVGVDANGKLWTAPGGQGGTTDYDQLSNRPSINGHTLTGNQTAEQLGLATPGDIPSVPVQSVNGKTGAVVLSASDVGALPSGTAIPTKTSDLTNDSEFVNASGAAAAAPVQSVNGKTGAVVLNAADVGAGTYSKPSGGIPASDLASGVIPTVPSAASSGTPAMDGTASRGSSTQYARADHVHPTDTSRAAASDLAAKYTLPSGGIPKTDLASAVQTSLGKADTALQSVPSTYRTAAAQDTIDGAQDAAIAAKYTKPSAGIPASDLAAGVIPTVPTNVSSFNNDAGYLTLATLPIYNGEVGT